MFSSKTTILGYDVNDLQIIGQEENGTLVLTWIEVIDSKEVCCLGMFDRLNTKGQVMLSAVVKNYFDCFEFMWKK